MATPAGHNADTDHVRGFHGRGRGRCEHFTFLHTDGSITRDPPQGPIEMLHTQSLRRALQLESVLAMIVGGGAFEENPSAGRPEAILGDAGVGARLEVIEPYMDREKKRCPDTFQR